MPTSESFVDLHFPSSGVDISSAFSRQPNKDIGGGLYARSTPIGLNVRGYEPITQRVRGGSRPGLARYNPSAVIAGWIIQETNVVTGTGYPPPGGHMEISNSGRVVTLVAVSQGNVYVASPGDTVWTPAINMSGANPPLSFTGIVYSTPNNQKLWFADGVNYVFYDPAINTVSPWTASAGSLPADSQNNFPRLITTWRGRIVLSGLLLDPQNWFMSAVSDPTNWDYGPLSVTPTQAIAGNNAPQGLIGDVVTSLCPYTDDVLVFFGDHTIYMMRGDPMAGGQIDLISDAIGGVWGICWCKDPYGNIFFLSNKTGVYQLVPGNQPQRISQQIEQLLLPLDTGANGFRLIWDDRWQGFHLFATPLAGPGVSTHFFYESRSGAWWTEQFSSVNFDPLCCVTVDGNTPGDRAIAIGSWDGYVRTFSPNATTDDGLPINSAVVIGPLLTKDLDEVLVKDLQAVLGMASGQVQYAVYLGATAEIALASNPVASGTWNPNRNLLNFVRRAGHACYIKLTSSNGWAMENIRCRIATEGKVRRRGV